MTKRFMWLLAALCLVSTLFAARQGPSQASAAPPTLGLGYAGMDYVDPSSDMTGCPDYTWLQATCYTDSSRTLSRVSPQQLLTSNLSYMHSQHLGTFVRFFISLDELMNWNSSTGYAGYNAQALANVDDMLRRVSAAGMKADLVLFVWNTMSGVSNMFHPEALDGNHAAMRANYLKAVHDFVAHVAANPTDASAVAVMDLQNEGYYQMETYFRANPARLGRWAYAMPAWPASNQCYVVGNTLCTGGGPGHGCLSASGAGDNACMDVNVIEPWLKDLYTTAKAAGPNFLYTVSDTGRLLTTSTSTYSSQSWWASMFPGDVYDVHLYDDAPWNNASRYATGVNLPKPWIVGESGCAIGNPGCTYNGTKAAPVDQWWLSNLGKDGASAVLVENRSTTFGLTDSPSGPQPYLTLTGQEIAQANLAAAPSASVATSTAVPSNTPTHTPTNTAVPTNTPTHAPTNTPTKTPLPTNTPTNTPVPTNTPTSTPLPTNTPTPASSALLSTNFDGQGAGALQLGSAANLFNGATNSARVSVENTLAASAPNALAVSLAGGGGSYVYKTYAGNYASHDLRFHIELGSDVTLPGSEYAVLARTMSSSSSAPGKVDLILNPSGVLFLDYTTASGARGYVWTKSGTALTPGSWHTLEMQETAGSNGTLRLLLDGQVIGQASGLNLGTQGIGYVAVGASTPADAGTSGHVYLDDVTATGA